MIKNKVEAHFVRIIGLAMDDNDRLFVSDPGLRHVLVFNSAHKAEDVITDGMVEPSMTGHRHARTACSMSPTSNSIRCWCMTPTTLKLMRKIGTTGHNHELTTPGDFAKPTGLAVDEEGNLYVCDTLNNRIEVFDADGKFITHLGQER